MSVAYGNGTWVLWKQETNECFVVSYKGSTPIMWSLWSLYVLAFVSVLDASLTVEPYIVSLSVVIGIEPSKLDVRHDAIKEKNITLYQAQMWDCETW